LALVAATLEVGVSDDWGAVAEAVRNRLAELGITQKELVARSGVSESTIRQLQNNYGPRRRSRHTLEDLSKGLGWPSDHLSHVLGGGVPRPEPGSRDALQAEVSELQRRVADLDRRVETLERGSGRR
jgi:transcriptional regulator with XRE-family HTH domain